MSLRYSIVIPARMASQRLPGKPLLEIAGRSLIEQVYRRAVASQAAEVVIATDDDAIFAEAERFGARVLMTAQSHQSGSDRIAECADRLAWDDAHVVVNLQGDEPLMPASCLDQVAELLCSDTTADAATLCEAITDPAEIENPNVVKVVMDAAGRALYFSRSVVPFPRHSEGMSGALAAGTRFFRHIGLYAYRAGALRAFSRAAPSPLEQSEKLEQLRFLEHGRVIRVALSCAPIPAGVDTPDDLARVKRIFLE